MTFVPAPLLVMFPAEARRPLEVGIVRDPPALIIKLTLQLDDAADVAGCLLAAEQVPLTRRPPEHGPGDFAPPEPRPQLIGPLGVTTLPSALHGDETLPLGEVASGLRPVRLPSLEPKADWVDAAGVTVTPIVLACDTLRIEPGRLIALWRGAIPDAAGDRAVVALARAGDIARPRVREPARALLRFAAEEHDIAIAEDELALERHALQDEAPSPRLGLERFAAISAALAERREPRGVILARHGLDDGDFALEERAWLERMGARALDGDVSLALRFGESFVATQDALADPDELDAMIHEYVAVRAHIERGADPSEALETWRMPLSQWLRLDRYWRGRAAREPRVAAELQRSLSEAG